MRTPQSSSLFEVGDRVRYDEHTGRIYYSQSEAGVLLGYRVEWDDGYRDDPAAPLYTDEELEPAKDARDSR